MSAYKEAEGSMPHWYWGPEALQWTISMLSEHSLLRFKVVTKWLTPGHRRTELYA